MRVKKTGLKLNIRQTKIIAPGPITVEQIYGEAVQEFLAGALEPLQMVTAAMKIKDARSLKEN